jgi:hypothetical protein
VGEDVPEPSDEKIDDPEAPPHVRVSTCVFSVFAGDAALQTHFLSPSLLYS